MFVTVPEDLFSEIYLNDTDCVFGSIFGIYNREDELYQIWGYIFQKVDGSLKEYIKKNMRNLQNKNNKKLKLSAGYKNIDKLNHLGWIIGQKEWKKIVEREDGFLIAILGKEAKSFELYTRPQEDKELILVNPHIINYKSDIFSRIQGVLDNDILINKKVAIIGLGTGGSIGAVELAKCGVGNFKLVDFDRLETHNISRHACGINDIGRFKTNALKDLILNKNPLAKVKTYNFDVMTDKNMLKEIIRNSDLVFVATDSERSKLLINKICLDEKIMAIYGSAYERAIGGDVIRVIPGETPCYDCVLGTVVRGLGQPNKGVIDYSNVQDANQVKAEPGLSVDVGFITLIQVKLAILTLLKGHTTTLEDIPYNYVLWGNKAEWIFKEPFQRVFAKTSLRKNCETCQSNYGKLLGMSDEDINKKADEIIANLSDDRNG